ncbi:MAG TPA: TadE family protein [Solimonas sp.]
MFKKDRQRGATAVEYALVFPVFFLLFYGMLSYGVIFMMRLNLQHSAEEGARAALRHQRLPSGNSESPPPSQLELRRRQAEVAATRHSSWINAWKPGLLQIQARICPADAAIDNAAQCPPGSSATNCDLLPGCQVVVTMSYPYAAHANGPALPPLPGFGLMIPNYLTAQARSLLDGRALDL